MARLAWAVLVVGAMALMTVGLWETVHFEPTSEALAAEDRGELLVPWRARCSRRAYVAHRWLGAATWVVVAVATPIVVCGGHHPDRHGGGHQPRGGLPGRAGGVGRRAARPLLSCLRRRLGTFRWPICADSALFRWPICADSAQVRACLVGLRA